MAAEVKTEPASFSPPAAEAERAIKEEPATSETAQPATASPEAAEPAVASSTAPSAPTPGPGSEGRKVNTADIQLVQNLIERCLQMYLSQREVVSTLHQQAKIEPGFTQLVWQKLEEQNPDFFRAYFTRLKLKDQINLFNHLLEQQVNVVQRMQRGWMQPPGMMMQPMNRPGMPMQNLPMQPGMQVQSQFPATQQVKLEQDGMAGMHPLESTADFDATAQQGAQDNLLPEFGLNMLSSPAEDGNAQSMPTDFGFPSPGRVQGGFPAVDEQWGFPRNLSLSDLSLDNLAADSDHNVMALWNTEGHHELPAMPKNMSFSELPQLDYDLDK